MEKEKPFSCKSPEILYLSFFGLGFINFAPGTVATLASLPIFITLSVLQTPLLPSALFFCFATVASCYMADNAQKKFQVHDPSWIVIDEVLGMAFAWMFLQSFSLINMAILFFLFRFFDIVKPFPANIFDKKVQHGAGVILDDVVSGLYAGLALRFVFKPALLHYL